ncbi:MAG: hypothetical protein ACOC4K_05465 [Verrucomicrobiota bacterium]
MMRKTTLRAAFSAALCLCLALGPTGCKREKIDDENLKIPRLMVETRGQSYGGSGEVVRLPVSGSTIPIQTTPAVNEFEIRNVELVKVEMGMALLIQTTDLGARALYRATVTNMGGRIVLTINGNAVGARRIDGAISDGNLYTFVEVPEEDLGQLVLDIRETIAHLQTKK